VPSIGFGEILLILVLALIIFGPRRLPEMGRTIARSMRDFRRATSEIRSELEMDLDEPPQVTVEERARRIEERKARRPSEGSPPPD
jgi:sec-independent protein translocase protein TatA